MVQYRRKPTLIEAVQFEGRDNNEVHFSSYPNWFTQAVSYGELVLEDAVVDASPERVRMTTIHGDTAYARPGDWIVPDGESGRFYPVAADVFAASYEEVGDDSSDEFIYEQGLSA